jgi:hypothetical protein
MAHFAQLDTDNKVTQVIVVHNNELMVNGQESETKGIEFCQSHFGLDTRWVQTSYNRNFRKHLALPGYTYSADLDAFIPPKRFNSWILDPDTLEWQAPITYPTDGKKYVWDEPTVSWKELV